MSRDYSEQNVVAQATPFPPGITGSQSWIREPVITPDWERIGYDMLSAPAAYNAAFAVWA